MSDYDDNEHTKETFAYFGRAYYMANVFEEGLAIAIMQLGFLKEVKRNFLASDRKSFDRKQYEEDFDDFMRKQNAQSLGNLIKSSKKFSEIPIDFHHTLDNLKSKRDFLAHHFFRERAVEFMSRNGRDKMILELVEAHEIFTKADRDLDNIMRPIWEELGLSEKMLEIMQEKLLQEANEAE